jgi:uncharacterized Zn finger protein
MIKESFPCPKCGGQREYFEYAGGQVLMKERFYGPMQILVCLSCGHVDLTSVYVKDVEALQRLAEKRRKKQG